MTIEKLASDIAAAKAAAMSAGQASDDGGTCNFDSLFIPVGKSCTVKRRSKAIDAVVGGFFHRSGWRRGYVVSVGPGGQGNKNTRAAEAACRTLRELGWSDVSVWYQMD